PGQLAGAFLDRPLEGVGRHVDTLGLLDRRLEPHVALGVAAADPRCRRDLADQLGEELAALLVVLGLLPLDLRPLRMPRHPVTSFPAPAGFPGRGPPSVAISTKPAPSPDSPGGRARARSAPRGASRRPRRAAARPATPGSAAAARRRPPAASRT